MATVKKLFSDAIQKGMQAASGITDSYQKASAYAALADAMAKTGLVTGANLDEDAGTAAAATTTEKGKDSLKPEAAKAKTTPTPAPKKEEKKVEPEPAAEEPAAEEEPELTEEWNDEMIALKGEQIEFINQLKEQYEEDALNGCVQQFSEGTMNSLDEISPLNIDAFVAFMQALINQQEG